MVIESLKSLSTCIQLRMTKHPSRKIMNFRHLLGCDTIVLENILSPSAGTHYDRNNTTYYNCHCMDDRMV